jgi:adenylate cyclase
MTSPEPTTPAASPEQRGERAAVLIADMVAFSRRMEQDQVGSVGHVTRSIQLFRALIGDYGGQIANLSGDGILALFNSAKRALQFAVQIQTDFETSPSGATVNRSNSASGSMSAK